MKARRPVLLVALLAATLLAGGCRSTGEPVQGSSTEVRAVTDAGLTQTVVPRGDGFSRVTLTVATYGESAISGVLELNVTGGEQTRQSLVDAATLADNAPVTFVFPPVAHSAGARFRLHLTYRGPDQVGVYVNPHDPYPDGRLEPGGGDLAFVLGHASRVSGTVDALGRIPGEVATRATADPAFLAIWLLALVAAVAGAVVAGRRRRARR